MRVGYVCVRENITLRIFDSKKITLHTSQRLVLDARVHYTILKPLPNTTPHLTAVLPAAGWVGACGTTCCDSRTQQRACPTPDHQPCDPTR